MIRTRIRWWAALLAVFALLAAACGDDSDDDSASDDTASDSTEETSEADAEPTGTVVVGSTDFTEQFIVASMYGQMLEANGYDVEVRSNLGTREIVFPSLEAGEIDLVAEYTGTLLEFLNEGAGEATSDLDATLELLSAQLESAGLSALTPADAEDKNAFALTSETADELGVTTLSDLADIAGDLTLGGPPECPERPLCAVGLADTYGIEFGDFVPLDAGGPLTYEALESGEIDVAVVFSSQGQIAEKGLVLLEDDQGLQPAENLTPVIRVEVLTDDIAALLDQVSAVLTTADLAELNRRVDSDLEDPEDVALDYLMQQGLVSG